MSYKTPVKWVSSDLMHITLLFLGELSAPSSERLMKFVDDLSMETEAFEIQVCKCGSFNRNGIPGVFWLGTDNSDQLNSLYKELTEKLPPEFIPERNNSFKPHITIGRNKRHFANSDFYEQFAGIKDSDVCRFRVNSFSLVESFLKKEGPVYKERKEILLT